LINLFIFRK